MKSMQDRLNECIGIRQKMTELGLPVPETLIKAMNVFVRDNTASSGKILIPRAGRYLEYVLSTKHPCTAVLRAWFFFEMGAFTILLSDGPDVWIYDSPIDDIHRPKEPTLASSCRCEFWRNIMRAFHAQTDVGLHGFLRRKWNQRHVFLLVSKKNL
jgi:hypothetical protein